MSASHYNAAPLHGSPLVSAAQGNMIQGGSHPTQAEPCWLVRYELAFLAFFGFFNVYAMRVNLSVAVVEMVKESGNFTGRHGEVWTEGEQGNVLGSFFYGYIFTQVLGGWLATKFGGKWVFGIGVLGTALLTVITPIVAKQFPFWVLILVRILEGVGEGVTFPAMHGVWARWAPPMERSKLATMSYSGAYVGTIVSMPLSGWLCGTPEYGWPSVFYLCGGLGVVWFVLWICLVHSDPSTHPRISRVELDYIQGSLRDEPTGKEQNAPLLEGPGAGDSTSTPWKEIMCSGPVWAIIVGHFCNNWGFYNLLTCLPSYLNNVLRYDIKHAGFIAGLPYVCMAICGNVWAPIVDRCRKKNPSSTGFWRKISQSSGHLIGAAALVACGYAPSGETGHVYATVCLCVAVGAGGFALSGFNVNHLDIAPKYAGVLMGITNTFATIPGFAAPLYTKLMTHGVNVDTDCLSPKCQDQRKKLQEEWQIVFFTAAGIYVGGVLIYVLCASGEKQPWSEGPRRTFVRRV